jgi:molecular chaperone Hsp33
MKDILLRASVDNLNLRCFFVNAHTVSNEICKAHEMKGLAKELMRRTIAISLLTSPLLSEDERYTIRFQYNGLMKMMVLDVASNAQIRGFASALEVGNNIPMADIIGTSGKIGLVKSNSKRQLNSGMTLADCGDPALDLATFFNISDQLPTAISVFENKTHCCAWMIQAMPGHNPMSLDDLQNQLVQPDFERESLSMLTPQKDFNTQLLTLLKKSGLDISESKVKHHETLIPRAFCTCTHEKTLGILNSVPSEELEFMISKDDGAEISCQFCSKNFIFNALDLRKLINARKT